MLSTVGLPWRAVCGLVTLLALSSGVFLFGVAGEPQRIWAGLLVVSYGLLSCGVGGAALLALFFVTGARWCDVIRPTAEKLTRLIPVGAAGVAVVLVAHPSLYAWTAAPTGLESHFQTIWLSRPFFLLRAFIYLALWITLAALLVRASRRQTVSTSSENAAVRVSALFLVIFAVTCWLASVDWIMSLEPKWASAIFGIYNFAGMFLGALAAFIVLAISFDRRREFGSRLTADQLRDLGTLVFSFSSFWMYIWFSQYLLIWYVNNPEEAEYYALRQHVQWQPLFLANLVLNWGLPFSVLLFRRAKESPPILVVVAVIVLLGRFVDLVLMILPPLSGQGTVLGIWDACLLPGMIALAALILAKPSPLEARA
jgi:hypothetical protein